MDRAPKENSETVRPKNPREEQITELGKKLAGIVAIYAIEKVLNLRLGPVSTHAALSRHLDPHASMLRRRCTGRGKGSGESED